MTVGVGTLFASRWLSPRLSGFWASFPEIAIRLVHSPTVLDILPEGFDAAIVWGRGEWPGVTCERILQPKLLPIASPAYINKFGRPARPEQLPEHHLIQEKDFALWWAWFEAAGCDIGRRLSGNAVGDGAVAMQLALDGQGILLGVHEFVGEELRRGTLIPLFEPIVVGEFAYYLLFRKTFQGHGASRSFREWVLGASADD